MAADTAGETAYCRPRVGVPGDAVGGAGVVALVPELSLVHSDAGAEPVGWVGPAFAVAEFGHMGTVVKGGWQVRSMG